MNLGITQGIPRDGRPDPPPSGGHHASYGPRGSTNSGRHSYAWVTVSLSLLISTREPCNRRVSWGGVLQTQSRAARMVAV